MRKIVEYKIVYCSLKYIEEAVLRCIKEWRQPFSCPSCDSMSWAFVQAMVKYEDDLSDNKQE